jgi:hypothetical protein
MPVMGIEGCWRGREGGRGRDLVAGEVFDDEGGELGISIVDPCGLEGL